MGVLHKVIFYPVGNGDTSQTILHNGKRILFDFCHREKSTEPGTPEIDLKSRLKQELKDADRDYIDVVAFTHADRDHIQGSTDFFELEYADCYRGNGRIKIRELWVPAAMVVQEASLDEQSAEFVLLRQEARHRLLEGNGVRIFSKPDKLTEWLTPALEARGEGPGARDHLFVDAGTLVPGFELMTDCVEFFVHSPFIEHCDGGTDVIRNSAALVFNVRFNADGRLFDYLEVGDAEYCDLEDIVRVTRYHGNDDRLAWDLFNIPHHCSYRALSDEKGDRETVPTKLVEGLLLSGRPGSYIVSCSNPVRDEHKAYEEVQPPHIQARKAFERYRDRVEARRFLVTMEEPNAYQPEPIVFEIENGGISWRKSSRAGAATLASSRPPRAG